jgi:hypothetical protein
MAKKTVFLRGMLAMALTFGMICTACNHDSGSDIPGPGPQPGPGPSPQPGPTPLTGTEWSFTGGEVYDALLLEFWSAPNYGTVSWTLETDGRTVRYTGTYTVTDISVNRIDFKISVYNLTDAPGYADLVAETLSWNGYPYTFAGYAP